TIQNDLAERVGHESQRSGQSRTSHRRDCRCDLADLCCAPDSAEHKRGPIRHRAVRSRALRKLVSTRRRGCRACQTCSDRIARLRIAFGAGESPVYLCIHGFSLLLAERFFEMARGIACASTVAWLGTGDDESLRRTRWQGVLETAELSLWRGISAIR